MRVRILIGVVLIGALVGVLAVDGWLWSLGVRFPVAGSLVLMALITLAAFELFRMISVRVPELGVRSATLTASLLTLIRLVDVAFMGATIPVALYCFLLVLCVFLPEVFRPRIETAGPRVAGRLMGLVFLLPLTFLIDVGATHGPFVLGWLVLASKGSDIGGFFGGKLVGGARLAPRVSPNKTIAGLVGGLVLATAVVLAGRSLLDSSPSLGWALLFGLCLGLSATLGDLCESVLKRSFDVKDSAVFIGEAGGVLDLLDSLVLSAPVGYLFLVRLFPIF